MKADLKSAPDGYPIKLVRDLTPEVINASGQPGELFYGPLPPGEDKMTWLRRKLGEEVFEYALSGGFNELLDVIAVVEALCEAHGRGMGYALMAVQNHPRSGFHGAVMMYGKHKEFDDARSDIGSLDD